MLCPATHLRSLSSFLIMTPAHYSTYDDLPTLPTNPFFNKPGLQRCVRALKLLKLCRPDLCNLRHGYVYEALSLLAASKIRLPEVSTTTGFETFKSVLQLLTRETAEGLDSKMAPSSSAGSASSNQKAFYCPPASLKTGGTMLSTYWRCWHHTGWQVRRI